MAAMTKLMNLKQMEPIARDATRRALEGVELASDVRERVVLGQFLEPECGVFELYIPGARPTDARVISVARVNRRTGEVSVEVRRASAP
jgi:hypothetical protein